MPLASSSAAEKVTSTGYALITSSINKDIFRTRAIENALQKIVLEAGQDLNSFSIVENGKIHKVERRNGFIACQNSSCQISKATAFSICESCENVSEISNSKLSKYLSNFSDDSGMKYSKYNLEFFGLCKKCKSK